MHELVKIKPLIITGLGREGSNRIIVERYIAALLADGTQSVESGIQPQNRARNGLR